MKGGVKCKRTFEDLIMIRRPQKPLLHFIFPQITYCITIFSMALPVSVRNSTKYTPAARNSVAKS